MAERRPPIRYIRGGLGLPMFRVRRPPEWGVEPVPPAVRVLRTFDLFVLWSSLGVGLLVLAARGRPTRVRGSGVEPTVPGGLADRLRGSVRRGVHLRARALHEQSD